MPIHHQVEQGSEAWDRLRLGIPTASEFKRLISPRERKESRQWKKYAFRLLGERITMRPEDQYTSEEMWRGKIVESEAAAWYEMERDIDVATIGFISSDEHVTDSRGYEWARYGCSPDRIVGETGLLEVKCAKPGVHLEKWCEPRPDLEHWSQLQGQLFVSERDWVDILFFPVYPELFPKVIIRVERDETFIKLLDGILRRFNEFTDGVMDKLGTLQLAPPPQQELRAMLHASLGMAP